MFTQVALKASLFPVTKADLKQLTVILHAELLPVDCPLSGNFSTSFQMLHLHQEKQVTNVHRKLQKLKSLHYITVVSKTKEIEYYQDFSKSQKQWELSTHNL